MSREFWVAILRLCPQTRPGYIDKADTMDFLKLPSEVTIAVAKELEPLHLFNLALTCRALEYLIRDDTICKSNLKVSLLFSCLGMYRELIGFQRFARFSPECRDAETRATTMSPADGSFSRAWRRFVKRKLALQAASPFSASIIAMAQTYMYKDGLLAYVADAYKLRLLSFQDNVSEETVVDVQTLVSECTPVLDNYYMYRFRPIHYSHGILTCLFSRTHETIDDEGWLFIWAVDNPKDSLKVISVEVVGELFVRNNRTHLYCGVSTPADELTSEGWSLRGFKLTTGEMVPGAVVLPTFIGKTLGINAAFEVIDDYLYGASSEGPRDVSCLDANTSFYYAFRFRMGDHDTFQELAQHRSQRSFMSDEIVDHRWSTFELVQDETTGAPTVYETQKECSSERGYSQRRCYIRELNFEVDSVDGILEGNQSTVRAMARTNASQARQMARVHVGDSGSHQETPNFTDSLARWYSPSAKCFVDLARRRWEGRGGKQSFNLRVRPQEDLGHLPSLRSPRARSIGGEAIECQPGVFRWPQSGAMATAIDLANEDPTDELMGILELKDPSQRKAVMSADEKCVLFSQATRNSPGQVAALAPIRLLCFDPGVRFYGHRSLGESSASASWSIDEVSSNNTFGRLREGGAEWVYKTQASYVWIRSPDGNQKGFDLD